MEEGGDTSKRTGIAKEKDFLFLINWFYIQLIKHGPKIKEIPLETSLSTFFSR